jgi:hypothetical protein
LLPLLLLLLLLLPPLLASPAAAGPFGGMGAAPPAAVPAPGKKMLRACVSSQLRTSTLVTALSLALRTDQ